MILPDTEKIAGPSGETRILQWKVWFQTPRGLVFSLANAVKIYNELGLPTEGIRYVAVAIGEDGYYEIVS